MAVAIAEELGSKDLQKPKGSDLDVFYDRLNRRGLSATSVGRYHAVCSVALNQGVKWSLLERSPAAQASPPSVVPDEPDARPRRRRPASNLPTPRKGNRYLLLIDEAVAMFAEHIFGKR